MKDILSIEFTNLHRNNVVFDIVKDNKLENYSESFWSPKTFGLEIEQYLKKKGYKLVFNFVEHECGIK